MYALHLCIPGGTTPHQICTVQLDGLPPELKPMPKGEYCKAMPNGKDNAFAAWEGH